MTDTQADATQTMPQLPIDPPMLQPEQPLYQQIPPILAAIDWLLANPSVPLSMRKQFYVLWELAVFGNYSEMDIKRLLLKFKEWCILLKWYIPDVEWDKKREFEGDTQNEKPLEMDLNILLNTLEQLYYIQLTRGKEGFTVKEMNTRRDISKMDVPLEEKKGRFKISIF